VDLAERHRRSQREFLRQFGTYVESPHGSVLAAVTPAAPDRSLPNSVKTGGLADVVAALPALRELYAAAGIRAWTVWVQPEHGELRAALEAAGFAIETAELSMVPKTTVAIEDESTAKKVVRLVEGLEESDDVQDVYANFDIPERVLEAVAS